MKRLIPYAALAAQLLGSVLIGVVVGRTILPHDTAVAASPPVFTEPAACADCPADAAPQSVEVQRRQGSVLFAVGGRWPATVDALHTGVRLVTDDLDVVLVPHGGGNAFELRRALRGGAALPAGSVAAGIQSGVLLVSVRDTLLTTPVHFAVGLWDGQTFHGRLPGAGLLTWDGQGAPHGGAASTPAPPATARPSPTATPSAPATPTPSLQLAPTPSVPVDLLGFASACTGTSSGSVPPYLEIASVRGGRGVDPRTGVVETFVAVTTRSAIPAGPLPPFTVTIAIQPPGQAAIPAPGGSRRSIDATGTTQLYDFWDGVHGLKGIRTRTGTGPWTLVQGSAASALTVSLGTDTVAFYFSGFATGDRIVAITADAGGCRISGLT